MRIADQIWARTSAGAIGYTCVIALGGAVGYAKRGTRLGHRDARDLPSTEQCLLQSRRPLEEGQGIHVADREVVTHVECGAGAICCNVIGVDEGSVAAVRGVVNRVAVSIGKTHRKSPHCTFG